MKHAPGLTPAAVFEKLATIQMVEVWIPMVDGRWLVMPRHTQPEPDVQALQSSPSCSYSFTSTESRTFCHGRSSHFFSCWLILLLGVQIGRASCRGRV